MKKLLKLLFHRVVLVALCLLVQVLLLLLMLVQFNEYFTYFYMFSVLLSVGVVLHIIGSKSDPGFKIAWLIPILLVPVFGGLFYLMFGNTKLSDRTIKKMQGISDKMLETTEENSGITEEIAAICPAAGVQCRYISDYAYSPPYVNSAVEYLPLGEVKFARMLEELKKAQHFIFLEYFIIEPGKMWDSILAVLAQKAKEGVDVRLIYDDMGCIRTLPAGYYRELRKMGIQAFCFNPFVPVLSSRLNNRDHRKICVIDGHTGFTGGINLADEYINAYQKHGHWKDTSILIRGDAVWSLTLMFLSMWDYITGETATYDEFRPNCYLTENLPSDGFVQPFTDNPLDGEPVGENVYMNLITKAERYVYITTPYLIISDEMVSALCVAAKGGVEVRIITPHIADKWFVHAVTRAYYQTLVEAGVKIFEYTPGFIHAKMFVVDDAYAVVGTINLDYRSLYLHFECATLMYKSSCVKEIRDDILATEKVSQQITLEDCRKIGIFRRFFRSLLRVFAPLM